MTHPDWREPVRCGGWSTMLTPGSVHDNRFHGVFFVLNNCCALQDLHEGMITSTRAGMLWAKAHLDQHWHDLIDHCWQQRQDPGISVTQPADRDALRRTMAFMEYTTDLTRSYRLA